MTTQITGAPGATTFANPATSPPPLTPFQAMLAELDPAAAILSSARRASIAAPTSSSASMAEPKATTYRALEATIRQKLSEDQVPYRIWI